MRSAGAWIVSSNEPIKSFRPGKPDWRQSDVRMTYSVETSSPTRVYQSHGFGALWLDADLELWYCFD